MPYLVKTEGLERSLGLLDGFSARRTAAVIATALTRSAVEGKAVALRELLAAIDRPTPYTQRSLYMRGATANRLQAEVGFKDDLAGSGTPATKYLLPNVEGTPRHIKRFELALQHAGAMPKGWHSVPAAGARLDEYGNISRGQIAQILSQVGTELTAGYNRTLPKVQSWMGPKDKRLTQNKRRRAFGRAGGQFFALPQGKGKLKPGVYLAGARDFGAKWGLGRTGRITPVLIFVRATHYKPLMDFYGVVGYAVRNQLPAELSRAVLESAQRLAAQKGRA